MNFPAAAMVEAKRRGFEMIKKKIINPQRVRCINGGFSFIPHRFLTAGFLQALSQPELLLYIFLVLAADRYGLSYYSYDSICSLLQLTLEDYIQARDGLLKRDLIAFDGSLFQVLSLPQTPCKSDPTALKTAKDMQTHDPATINQLIKKSLGVSS